MAAAKTKRVRFQIERGTVELGVDDGDVLSIPVVDRYGDVPVAHVDAVLAGCHNSSVEEDQK